MRYLFLFLIFVPAHLFSQTKTVCFTYDDLPVVHYGASDPQSQQNVTTKLVEAITGNGIPAIGFVNEIKLHKEGSRIDWQVDMLKQWLDNGLELGNHTFSHPDYNSTSLEDFIKDIRRGETITREILSTQNHQLRFFRHPYLHTGTPRERADSLDAFLAQNGYTVAPVTIDNDDYLFALAYRRALARNDNDLATRIGTDYIAYMEQKVLYFERQAVRLFDRNISQILLLHANQLNADYTPALATMFRRNGYTFVSLEEALKDTAYKTPVSVFGKWGISWIDRWALSAGKKGDFFKDDPATPEYVRQLAQ